MTPSAVRFATAALAVVLAGCSLFGRSDDRPDRFVRPGAPRPSPSGRFSAALVSGPKESGVETLVVVIKDQSGAEVFRDDHAYSSRHGVGATWLTGRDQLWLLSADVGTSYVEDLGDGWQRVAITPETRARVPAEIAALR